MTGMMAKRAATGTLNNMEDSLTNSANSNPNSNIDWNNFNYPPLIKVVHYDLDELQDPQRAICRKLDLSMKITVATLLLNLFTSIWVSVGLKSGSYVLYSVLNFVIIPPLAIYSMYKGYRGICANPAELKIWKITQGILIVLYILFSIIAWLSFHGWAEVGNLFSGGFWFQGLLAIVESLIWEMNALLSGFMFYVIHNYSSSPAAEEKNKVDVTANITMA
mmetsp:Transcript_33228/g.38699  ORF Transcript_33228/g.38699 Transcript_33228/m.38699 type:complete len:220 (+) Transcript_33228:3-662(+)|eukprot:CAMPEP_0176475044 /NCGR_PEP_ID=MMETSP0127-20121128/43383_1 /TAXON_ID=938130 /ORGANISM="Platyophrya macrostoma, Strain WH" /LENGTH=219 /DNA_ID=CAMNT_0017870587 /DNA_START=41 /DNA_END=700 /DNA_ORIENTATION=+